MAISTSYNDVKESYNPKSWSSIEEFEEYYLQEHAEKGRPNYYTNNEGKERFVKAIDHFPELKEYEVWSEGYAATGNQGTAHLHGKAKARNFAQACHIVMCTEYLKKIEVDNNPVNTKYVDAERWDYDPNNYSYWGCALYWSEDLASKSFG